MKILWFVNNPCTTYHEFWAVEWSNDYFCKVCTIADPEHNRHVVLDIWNDFYDPS